MRDDGAVAVVGREVVALVEVVSAQRHVVDGRRRVAELERRCDAAHHVTQSQHQLHVDVAHDGRRRRREEHVADDVVERSTTRRRGLVASPARQFLVCLTVTNETLVLRTYEFQLQAVAKTASLDTVGENVSNYKVVCLNLYQ